MLFDFRWQSNYIFSGDVFANQLKNIYALNIKVNRKSLMNDVILFNNVYIFAYQTKSITVFLSIEYSLFFFSSGMHSGADYRMCPLSLGSGVPDKSLWISGWNSNKMKIFLYKNGKNWRKKCFPPRY